MDEASAFANLVGSLRLAAEITKAMMDTGASRMHAKLFELIREIMSAQSSALVSQDAYLELLQNKRGVEEETTKLKAWNMEKKDFAFFSKSNQSLTPLCAGCRGRDRSGVRPATVGDCAKEEMSRQTMGTLRRNSDCHRARSPGKPRTRTRASAVTNSPSSGAGGS
jgi:hypothetical protein